MGQIEGVCPILATPFTDDGEIDHASLRRLVSTLIEDGAHGITLFGVASEVNKLSDAERKKILSTVIAELDDEPISLIVNITEESAELAVKRAKHAESMGADCLMVLPPSFLAPSVADHYTHVSRIGKAVDIPILIQYRPQTTGVRDIGFYVELDQELDNLKYFKVECVPPGPTITTLIEHDSLEIRVLEGFAGLHMIEAFDRGAIGVMPGSSLCQIYVDIYERYRSGDRDRALALHNELVPMLSHLRQSAQMLIHYEKRMLMRRGVIATDYCRFPRFRGDDYFDQLFEDYFDAVKPHLS